MTKPSLLILSLGELGTCMLEAAARSDLFDTILVASRSLTKAQERAGNAITGAGIEGYFPDIRAVALDFTSADFPRQLRDLAPDYLFSAPSMMPWWRLDQLGIDLPFAAYTPLHLSLMAQLRDQMARADCKTCWIGASYPDVINAVLNRTGHGPDCGIGNVQEPIPKIRLHVAHRLGVSPQDVRIQLVAQHAFEYYVLNATRFKTLPPHLLRATVHGKDVTDVANSVLRDPFPFPYDLHFNRVTASAGIEALRALTSETPVATHLPGVGKHLGGYPVLASTQGIEIALPDAWTLSQAQAVNHASLSWDGIEDITDDGTLIYSETTRNALHDFLGHAPETLTPDTAHQQAQTLMQRILG
ncbi:MAG: hypothetical protein N4A61_05865 [Pelagimonas sp.]|jgi:hypothetical protein|nr:hypothetical protein [Pelagimonas sp.]